MALIELHSRTHSVLAKLFKHCCGFSSEELDREHEGFGYPSIRIQLQHVTGAEQYWVGVINGRMLVDENEADAASIEALESFRARVGGVTRTNSTCPAP